MAEPSGVSRADCNAHREDGKHVGLEPKHKIFLSHSGAQKAFVENLCEQLERCLRYPFFDIREDSLPIGENFPDHIFGAIRQCHVGVVILSEQFFTSKWAMMELVAMVEEAEKRKSSFKIIPVFLRTSPAEFEDVGNRSRWRSHWQELALKYPKRVNVKKWEAGLEYLRGLNGVVYKDGIRESRFLEVIVDAICGVVQAEIRLEDSHMQGKSRLCRVICDEISKHQEKDGNGVCVVGLYGTGGMGKTTICKALCNEFVTKFRGRVCHAELERVSEEELLRNVLRRLSNTGREHLNGFNLGELRNGLKEGKFIKDAVFLAVDNMSDSNASIMEAKSYLSARLPAGSIVMVTTRSKDSLTSSLSPYLNESSCMGMPELEVEEAKALFVMSCEGRNADDEELIRRCVERCRFKKDGSPESYEYHPLALDVLGRELGRFIDPKEWGAELDMIDRDIFNQSKGKDHPIFSILRKSFDALCEEDQLLCMDVGLYLPDCDGKRKRFNVFHWLAVVHRYPRVDDVMKGLERLRRKSLVERVGDGSRRSIGMHDLWRAFCVAETSCGELRGRRWVYEAKSATCSELFEASPGGMCWENVKRMGFGEDSIGRWRSLDRVDFGYFSNITVLKISVRGLKAELVVDLSGLVHLKSLETAGSYVGLLVVQGLPRGLVFLRSSKWRGNPGYAIDEVECLTRLQYLELHGYAGGILPYMKSMISIREANFTLCRNVETVSGLSSKLTNLRVLDFGMCGKLRSCPGVGDLVNLEELQCRSCEKLERLPNLGQLRKLRKLSISRCELIIGLPGLGELVALEELYADGCSKLRKLPDMRKLVCLRVLDMWGCESVIEVPGLESLISLQTVMADFRAVVEWPNLRQLTKLEEVLIDGWCAAGIQGLGHLAMLRSLRIGSCRGLDELPDFGSLIRLRELRIKNCEFTDVSGLTNLSGLRHLKILACRKLERLPDMQRLTRLERLTIGFCRVADMTSIGGFTELENLRIESLVVRELPDLSNFSRLKTLELRNCEILMRLICSSPLNALSRFEGVGWSRLAALPDLCNFFPGLVAVELERLEGISTLSSSGPLTALRRLSVKSCDTLTAVPDLGMFPPLNYLTLEGCSELRALSSSGPLSALRRLSVKSCDTLTAVPDLGMFPALKYLTLEGCSELRALSSSGRLTALRRLSVKSCDTLTGVPDLGMVPALKCLSLEGFSELRALSSSGPLTALTSLSVKSCDTLTAVPDLGLFPALKYLTLEGCSELRALSSSGRLTALRRLFVKSCDTLTGVPDLGMVPALKCLSLEGFSELRALSSSGPLTALTSLSVESCDTLTAVPDLGMFPALKYLTLEGCSELRAFSRIGLLTSLRRLSVKSCETLTAVPDLGMFPALHYLSLEGCSELRALSSIRPLTALTVLSVKSCDTLTAVPDLGMFPALVRLRIGGCSELRALGSSVRLSALGEVDVSRCWSLSRDDVDQLRAVCPADCEIQYVDNEDVEWSWLSRLLGLCGGTCA